MPKSRNAPVEETEEQIMERMEQALKRALNKPHDTNKELVERQRRGREANKAPSDR